MVAKGEDEKLKFFTYTYETYKYDTKPLLLNYY